MKQFLFSAAMLLFSLGVQAQARVSVHDPSIVDDNGTYYIFGSHQAWAKSNDMYNWSTMPAKWSNGSSNVSCDVAFNTMKVTLSNGDRTLSNFDAEAWAAASKSGYDISGNDDINYYAARSFFRSGQFLHTISTLSFDGIGNTQIKWETTRRFNAGLEASFLNNRLSLGFNYFRSTTDNLLALQQLGFLSGLKENWSNEGKLKNEGFDVNFNAKVLNLKDWQWEVGASMGHYKNQISALPDGADHLDNSLYGATIRTQVGQAANLFYGYKALGVFSTTAEAQAASAHAAGQATYDPKGLYSMAENGIDHVLFEAGDVHFADLNGDGMISEADQTIIGDPNPDIYGNIFTSLSWKNLKLDLNFNYSLGNDIYNYMRSQLEGGERFMNQSTALLRRWQVEGQETDVPRIAFQDPKGNSRFSDRWIEDGSYLRLKTVTLSYNLPLKSEYIQGVQFWIQGNNLLTFTKYLGCDPEMTMTSSVLGQGIDLGRLPMSRSIVAGVKFNL